MPLPGGLVMNGEVRRDFAFRSMTGDVEMTLAACGSGGGSLPLRVTEALAASLSHLGGEEPDAAKVRRLTVGDRQFLMRRLAVHLGQDGIWLTGTCSACGSRFDLFVHQSELPVKPAGAGYPHAEAKTSLGSVGLRMPNGEDQETLAELSDVQNAARILAERLIVTAPFARPGADGLADADVAAIEAAAETVAPEVGLAVLAACPECGEGARVPVDPYLCLRRSADHLYYEIHLLASNYHWSETEILALPTARRRIYLRMVDRGRGMAVQQGH